MPIKPENKNRYPENWPEISAFIKFDRAEGRCECDGRCGDPQCRGLTHGRCNAEHGQPHPVNGKKTVMTCAHFNHTPEDCDEDNLGGYCSRCHIFYDREHHAITRQATRAARIAAERQRISITTSVLIFQKECGL